MSDKPEVEEQEELLPPREVARRLKVVPKTVSRWADQGKLTPIFLPSGHRRYRASEVKAILNPPPATPEALTDIKALTDKE